jgi:hypothetical protein
MQVEFRSHFSGEKCASYGPGNTVVGNKYIAVTSDKQFDRTSGGERD